MYSPTHFDETNIGALHSLIREHPLATLVTLGSSGLNANHIPLQLVTVDETKSVLQGHVARANPLWHDFDQNIDVLAVFQTANAYISPSWYASKQDNGKVVPTWNYATVHAYGTLRAIDDPTWLRAQLTALTAEQEASFPEPWAVSDAPVEFIGQLMANIVGIEITITRLLGKWKVSQNQPPRNQLSVVSGLVASGQDGMAGLVKAKINTTD